MAVNASLFGGADIDSYANGGNYSSSPTDLVGRWKNNLSGVTASNQFNSAEAEKARLFNSAEAQKARDFELYMSNTAYQRQVEDLKAAGLNPAAVNGNGASTPGAAVANSSPAAASSGFAGKSGISDMISRVASIAIGKALEAKFTHSAQAALDNHELIAAKIQHLAHQEEYNSARQFLEAERQDKMLKAKRGDWRIASGYKYAGYVNGQDHWTKKR